MSRIGLAARLRAEQDAQDFERNLEASNERLTALLGDDLDAELPPDAPRSPNHLLRVDTCGERFMWRCSCHTWGVGDTAEAARREYGVHADQASRVEFARAAKAVTP